MKPKLEKWKRGLARLMLAALVLQLGRGTAQAGPGPVALPVDIDLSSIAQTDADIDVTNTFLVKWRGGDSTTKVTSMSFSYFATAGRTTPDRTKVLDHTANGQGDLWSDNAIVFKGTKPNHLGNAILIYTNNTDAGNCSTTTADPLCNVQQRGGLLGGFGGTPSDSYRVSVLPLIWKAVPLTELQTAASATVDGSVKISTASVMFMPTQITAVTGGNCPADLTGQVEGPWGVAGAVARVQNGYCDFQTHYFVDKNNNIHLPNPGSIANSWYEMYTTDITKKNNAFNYSTAVGPFGANTTEGGLGNLQLDSTGRVYFLLGMNAANALQTHYGTTIYLEVKTN